MKTQIVGSMLLLMMFVLPTHAQLNEEQSSLAENSLRKGAWALQFGIGRDFTLVGFQGAIISVKHHISSDEAIRLGASISFTFTDNTGLSSAQQDTIATRVSNSGDNNSLTVDLRLQYLYYPNPEAEINFFIGTGPLLMFSRSSSERNDINEQEQYFPRASITKDMQKSWAVGLSGLAGVEWFFSRKFSLHAEYGVAVQYAWSNRTYENSVSQTYVPNSIHFTSESNGKGWQFNYQSVNFGLSVYL